MQISFKESRVVAKIYCLINFSYEFFFFLTHNTVSLQRHYFQLISLFFISIPQRLYIFSKSLRPSNFMVMNDADKDENTKVKFSTFICQGTSRCRNLIEIIFKLAYLYLDYLYHKYFINFEFLITCRQYM